MGKFTYSLVHTSDDGQVIWSRGGEFPCAYTSSLGLRTLENIIELIDKAGTPKAEELSTANNTPMQAEKLAQIAAFLRGLEEYKNEGRDMVMIDPIIERVRQLLHG